MAVVAARFAVGLLFGMAGCLVESAFLAVACRLVALGFPIAALGAVVMVAVQPFRTPRTVFGAVLRVFACCRIGMRRGGFRRRLRGALLAALLPLAAFAAPVVAAALAALGLVEARDAVFV